MPPAVAQAPIVIRCFDSRRTLRMRSASCAVVIDPSTNERSYGPSSTALDASGKLAIWMASASAKSSSSQSSNESWHPSHDANFQTASRGRFRSLMSDLPHGEDLSDAVKSHHRPVLADERGSELTATAKTDGAFHITLHRKIDMVGRDARVAQGAHREAHHDFRSANQRNGIVRIENHSRNQCRHDADVAMP